MTNSNEDENRGSITIALSKYDLTPEGEAAATFIVRRVMQPLLGWSARRLGLDHESAESCADMAIAKTFRDMREKGVSFKNRKPFFVFLRNRIRWQAQDIWKQEKKECPSQDHIDLVWARPLDPADYASVTEVVESIDVALDPALRPIFLQMLFGVGRKSLAAHFEMTEDTIHAMQSEIRIVAGRVLAVEIDARPGRPGGTHVPADPDQTLTLDDIIDLLLGLIEDLGEV